MRKFVLYLGFLFVCLFLVIPPFFAKIPDPPVLNFSLSPFTAISLTAALAMYYFYEFKENNTEKVTFFSLLLNSGKIFLYFGILIAVQTLFSIAGFIFHFNSDLTVEVEKKFIPILTSVLLMGITAFYEEVLYRLYLPSVLTVISHSLCDRFFKDKSDEKKVKLKKIAALVIEFLVVIIFGFSHLYLGLIPVLNAIVCGAILRLCLIKNKTVLIGTISHWLYNVFIFIAAILL